MRRWDWLSGVINANRYTRIVELGVHKGENARNILLKCPSIEEYLAVDQWMPTDDYPYDRLDDFESVLMIDQVVPGKIDMCESDTVVAATMYDGYADLVFIDADHSYEAVRGDIEAWYPLVRVGGILAGHDYNDRTGVKKAVKHAFGANHSTAPDGCWFTVID